MQELIIFILPPGTVKILADARSCQNSAKVIAELHNYQIKLASTCNTQYIDFSIVEWLLAINMKKLEKNETVFFWICKYLSWILLGQSAETKWYSLHWFSVVQCFNAKQFFDS